MKKSIPLFLAGALLLGLSGCALNQGKSAETLADATAAPAWVQNTPRRHGYAYGVASSEIYGSQERALETAREKAKADLLANIRVEISSSVDYSKTASMEFAGQTSLQETFAQNINSKVKNIELSGLQIQDTWVDAKGKEAWALAELNVAVAVEKLLQDLQQLEQRVLERGIADSPDRLQRIRSVKPSLEDLAQRRQILQQLNFFGEQGRTDAAQGRAVEQLEAQIADLLASLSIRLQAGSAQAGQMQPILAQALTDLGFNLVNGPADLSFDLQLKSSQVARNGLYYVDAQASGQMSNAQNRLLYVINADHRAVSTDSSVANSKAVNELAQQLAQMLVNNLYQKL